MVVLSACNFTHAPIVRLFVYEYVAPMFAVVLHLLRSLLLDDAVPR